MRQYIHTYMYMTVCVFSTYVESFVLIHSVPRRGKLIDPFALTMLIRMPPCTYTAQQCNNMSKGVYKIRIVLNLIKLAEGRVFFSCDVFPKVLAQIWIRKHFKEEASWEKRLWVQLCLT